MTGKTKIYILIILFFLSCTFMIAGNPLSLSDLHPSFSNQAGNEVQEKSQSKAQAAIKAPPIPTDNNSFKRPPEEEWAELPEEQPLVVNLSASGRAAGAKEAPPWDAAMVRRLSFLQSPIPGAGISTRDTQLPGAPRPYRNGTHEGLDYYNGYCVVPVHFGDAVYAAGDGVIYRIDHEYSEPALAERQKWLEESAAAGDTPEEILDRLRGRQVWIVHAEDVVTRYAHLDTVCEKLQLGDRVEAGEFIGTVGNSGTSNGARGTRDDAHLHFEIWVDNYYLGEGLGPVEVRSLWQQILLAVNS